MYRRPLLVLPYSERPVSNLYRKKLLYVLWQQTMGINFKNFFQRNICIDFSNGGKPEKRCETKKALRCVKEVPKIECLLQSKFFEIRG